MVIDLLILPDVAALCRAIDDGDDTALPILADALEEAGDERVRGMGSVCVLYPAKMPSRIGGLWHWYKHNPRRAYLGHHLIARVFDRLPPLDVPGREGTYAMHYPSRSAAFLALATALLPG